MLADLLKALVVHIHALVGTFWGSIYPFRGGLTAGGVVRNLSLFVLPQVSNLCTQFVDDCCIGNDVQDYCGNPRYVHRKERVQYFSLPCVNEIAVRLVKSGSRV